MLIGGANVLLMVALHAGSVAVVAVLVNLYPVATVLLAWIVLRERVNALQAHRHRARRHSIGDARHGLTAPMTAA